mgnify:FL=1
MGRRGKPKDMQKAHLTQAEKERREEEERTVSTGNEQLKTPPEWLFNRTAKAEWRRITKELQKIEVVGNLDKANLAGYCNAYAAYRDVTEKLKGEDYCIERETRNGTMIVKNPLLSVQKEYAEEMRKFAALCGMTVDARLKAAVIKVDEKNQEIEDKFGEI